jgi:hypothetical protein
MRGCVRPAGHCEHAPGGRRGSQAGRGWSVSGGRRLAGRVEGRSEGRGGRAVGGEGLERGRDARRRGQHLSCVLVLAQVGQ